MRAIAFNPGTTTKCPQCRGRGKLYGLFPVLTRDSTGRRRVKTPAIECDMCDGDGWVYKDIKKAIRVGRRMRKDRIAAGRTLRDEARRLGIDVARLSRLERGVE